MASLSHDVSQRSFILNRTEDLQQTFEETYAEMDRIVACTTITKSFLPFARTLARSLARHHAQSKLFVLLVDRVEGLFDPLEEPFEVIQLCDLDDQETIDRMCFYYEPYELCCALRPWLHEHLMKLAVADRWVFIDSDILVLGSLQPIHSLLDTASILLSPHYLSPHPYESVNPFELNTLRSGLYNGGVMGLKVSQDSIAFVSWWKQRLKWYCFNAPQDGQFLDQLWLNFVPLFFDGVTIDRTPGVNVGFWNLHERRLSHSGDKGFAVNGAPLLCFHFSGWSIDESERLSKFAPSDYYISDLVIQDLLSLYGKEIERSGYREAVKFPYSYSRFNSGERIVPSMRREYYRSLTSTKQASPKSPFDQYQALRRDTALNRAYAFVRDCARKIRALPRR